MPVSLSQAWRELIDAGDYEAHMASIGQAQANADLAAELLVTARPADGAAILFAGAGTGQMFDYLDPSVLRPYRTTFTDINRTFLDRLEARLDSHEIAFETRVDDVENSCVPGLFELVIAVLVLEHVEWRCAVAGLCRLSTGRVFVVIQENPQRLAASRPCVGTMNILREIGHGLIDRDELVHAFDEWGFRVDRVSSREVADSKKMIALEFVKERSPVITPPA